MPQRPTRVNLNLILLPFHFAPAVMEPVNSPPIRSPVPSSHEDEEKDEDFDPADHNPPAVTPVTSKTFNCFTLRDTVILMEAKAKN